MVGGELDRLVAPFGRPEVAGDDPGPVHAFEVADHERVAALGLIGRAIGQADMPRGVVVPRMPGEVGVLVFGARLGLAPVAVEDVLARLDELLDVRDGLLVERVAGHAPSIGVPGPRDHAR